MQYVNAFWVGGLICVAGQILIDKTKLTPARILTGFVVDPTGSWPDPDCESADTKV